MTVKTAEVDSNKIRYLEEGTSEDTLLLLHGLGASAESWEDVISLFAKKFIDVLENKNEIFHKNKYKQ